MFRRRDERAELKRLLMAGASIQMFAPRRLGKTWLMHELADDLRREDWTVIFIDVEGMSQDDEVLRALCAAIEKAGAVKDRVWRNLSQRFKQFASDDWEGSPIKAIGKIDPKRFLEGLVASLAEQDKNTLIQIDELALFVLNRVAANREAAHDFLYNLRRLRQDYPKVRWMFSGSIGLDAVARRHKLQGALVDMTIMPLEPFSPAQARAWLDYLCEQELLRRRFSFDDSSFDRLASQLGWLSPFYLKHVADHVVVSATVATPADIDRAFETLLQPSYRTYFDTWDEHFAKNFPDEDEAFLRAIIDICCDHNDGEEERTLHARLSSLRPGLPLRQLRDALIVIANSGLLHKVDERWRFRSGLLRRYWKEYLRA